MPLYEYRCCSCKTEFERLAPASAADSQSCPECESLEVSRRLSLFAAGGKAGASEAGGGGGSCCARGGCRCH
jgi:putative FmdB family regulatory protein